MRVTLVGELRSYMPHSEKPKHKTETIYGKFNKDFKKWSTIKKKKKTPEQDCPFEAMLETFSIEQYRLTIYKATFPSFNSHNLITW